MFWRFAGGALALGLSLVLAGCGKEPTPPAPPPQPAAGQPKEPVEAPPAVKGGRKPG